MSTETTDQEGGMLANFLDKIWLQFGITTGITVVWLIWILYEIVIKPVP